MEASESAAARERTSPSGSSTTLSRGRRGSFPSAALVAAAVAPSQGSCSRSQAR